MAKVSVIVPVYNVEAYLDKCLDSLVKQTLKDIEIIVINDGSCDNSKNIIEKYLKKYSNIIFIDDTNHGQGYARNKCIKMASAPYIMFVDSDDYVDIDMLKVMYERIILDESDVVVCDIKKVFDKEEVYFNNLSNFSLKDNINFMLSHPGPVAKLYKKKIFIDNNIFFLENVYYEDLAMTPIIGLYINKVSYVKEGFYKYLIRDNSTMKQVCFNTKINDIFKVINFVDDEFRNRCGSKYDSELEYLYIEHLLYSATLRYLGYKDTRTYLDRIVNIINDKFPNWKGNKYYKKKSFKFKIVCILAYNKFYGLLKILKKVSGN